MKIKVTSDGTIGGTLVCDADTGKVLPATRVVIEADKDADFVVAHLTVWNVELEMVSKVTKKTLLEATDAPG